MKVTGWGNPDRVRIRFAACEVDLLVHVLRERRADATCDAAETYGRPGFDFERAVDDKHDRLRAIEALFRQMEEGPENPDEQGRVVLVGDTEVMDDLLKAGAKEAIRRLVDAHDAYLEHPAPWARNRLLPAVETAHEWLITLASFVEVDQPADE
jgi:hypothetical protein